MRNAWLLMGLVVVSGGCEAPVEVRDRSVYLEAAWEVPAVALGPSDTVPGTPAVKVLDANGRPLAGIRVSFVMLTPPIWEYPVLATSGADGIATMPKPWLLGYISGTNQVAALIPSGQNNPPVVFSVTVNPGPATKMTASIGADTTIAVLDTATVEYDARDVFNNPAVLAVAPTLTSSDTTVLRVLAGNRIVGVAVGSALLRAVSAAVRDSMTIIVAPAVP